MNQSERCSFQTLSFTVNQATEVIPALMIPVGLLAFAGITKAAQMPFNSWLLGAMGAPTPTSALLHSSTMVKAGVFLILKLAPCLGWGNAEYGMVNYAGIMVMAVGGITLPACILCGNFTVQRKESSRLLNYSEPGTYSCMRRHRHSCCCMGRHYAYNIPRCY